ncbi:unnamed protein product [Microthlaspi erraticum]|uniref:Uncharacterized protein n=1 Tax=Microthlaspi erraticum TaxID=1685480 RepID=A0A6D2JMN0_9BRAS|nr:unnamed protein product [Microthlaspi erraticum]
MKLRPYNIPTAEWRKFVKLKTSQEFKQKANEFIQSDTLLSSFSNPKEDCLAQILGPDNHGRLRAMGHGMSMSKLACFQVKSKYVTEMQQAQVQLQQQVHELQETLAKIIAT